MAQEQAKLLLQQGIAAARAGRADATRDLLQQAVRLDPRNETIWLWLSSVARDDKERLFCLKQLLEINPENEFALKGLRALGAVSEEAAEPAALPTAVPLLTEDKYARILPAVDEFLHRYQPEPPDLSEIEWTHKPRRRYAEGGAQRVRQITFAAAAAVLLVVIGAGALLAGRISDWISPDSNKVAVLNTLAVPSTATPTLTPTPGGATPTPFPENMSVPATARPSGLAAGSVYGSTATAVYPPVNPNVANAIKGAISYYSAGEYPLAIGTLAAESQADAPQCYPAVRYFEAMSYARQGGTANLDRAGRLLEDALNYVPDNPRYNSCQNDPLVLAGLGYVRYAQGRPDEALNLSSTALRSDPKLVQAYLTIASVQMSQGQYAEARASLGPALREWPADVNLLLLAAQVEMADNKPNVALEQVGRALYVDPLSQPALRLQPEVYLALAAQTEDTTPREEYYGLAVRSAQTLLLYYPGDAQGYLSLGKARVGEGEQNYDLAEAALTRIIEARDSLPESEQPIVQEAFHMRGDLYYRQGRLQAARADLNQIVDVSGDEPVLFELATITLVEGAYTEAQDWVDQLVALSPDNPAYRLMQARLHVEICSFAQDVDCQYSAMLDTLDDAFVRGLDAAQQAEAYSFRAQARYQETTARRSLSSAQRRSAYSTALDDVNRALQARERAVDRYYRGLILEALGQLPQALEDYQWVGYWNALYAYPFVGRDFEDHIAQVIESIQAASVTPTPTATQAIEQTPAGQASRTPTALPPTRTPQPTATPRPGTVTPTQPMLP